MEGHCLLVNEKLRWREVVGPTTELTSSAMFAEEKGRVSPGCGQPSKNALPANRERIVGAAATSAVAVTSIRRAICMETGKEEKLASGPTWSELAWSGTVE